MLSQGSLMSRSDRVGLKQFRCDSFFERYITKDELARFLNVSRSLIDRLMATDGLPHLKIGRSVRFKVSDVLRWFGRKGMLV
ncbi:MAG: Helix-turn-helix domain [Pseudomonadota bacterium]|jgi:excisionase family DNA binding protein